MLTVSEHAVRRCCEMLSMFLKPKDFHGLFLVRVKCSEDENNTQSTIMRGGGVQEGFTGVGWVNDGGGKIDSIFQVIWEREIL